MSDAAWLDRIAYELDRAYRTLARAAHAAQHDQPDPLIVPGLPYRTLALPVATARALLRGIMPASIGAASHRRQQHARMLAALVHFGRSLPQLADTKPGVADGPIAAALDLADQLREWARRARWHQATAAAGLSWAAPAPVTAIISRATAEQTATTPDSRRGRVAAPSFGLELVREIAQRRVATQLSLHLEEPADPRQTVIPLPAPAARRAA